LAGIGAAYTWHAFERCTWPKWAVLPVTLGATAMFESYLLSEAPGDTGLPLIVPTLAFTSLTLIVLVLARVKPLRAGLHRAFGMLGATFAFSGLLVAPLVWSLIPVLNGGNALLPHGGPPLVNPPAGAELAAVPALAEYLIAQRGERRLLTATPISAIAEQLEVETGQPVMALGGFTGSDPVPDLDHLVHYVQSDQVASFVVFLSDLRVPANEIVIKPDLVTWLRTHCKPVGPAIRAVGHASQASDFVPVNLSILGDCAV
jgi:4-amino-4-deoxy-L-arabinose transferase-like glycosyltransferase